MISFENSSSQTSEKHVVVVSVFYHLSMDWFKGKSTGNHRFSHSIWGFPVNFPLIQFYDIWLVVDLPFWKTMIMKIWGFS
jgi:hypothetical protein